MKEERLDQEIKEALYGSSLRYSVPEEEEERIRARICARIADREKEEKRMKTRHMKKAVALIGTVCMATGKIRYTYSGSSPADASTEFADLKELEKETGVVSGAVEAFSNGYVFKEMNVAAGGAVDEDGNKVQDFKELNVTYEKDGKQVIYDVAKRWLNLNVEAAQVIERDGQTYYYYETMNKFVPGEYEATDEELAAMEAGTLNLAYGSEEIEELSSTSLYWQNDSGAYGLYGFETDLGAEELLAMALELQK